MENKIEQTDIVATNGNALRIKQNSYGNFTVGYWDNDILVECNNGISADDLGKEITAWIKRGYKA